MISFSEIHKLRQTKQARKDAEAEAEKKAEADARGDIQKDTKLVDDDDHDKEDDNSEYNPMQLRFMKNRKFPIPWGGVIQDIKTRYPWYLSDILDGINGQSLAAAMFIYFACLSGAIAFGGLLGSKTQGLIGIPETIITSAVAGILFALFAGQPLIITGVTGPVLLYDEALFQFRSTAGIEYLPWRVWIGIWTVIIALIMSFFQGSVLVKHFTKFTKDIFASLVALLFIFEALVKLSKIFASHPLESIDVYCNNTDEKSAFLDMMTNDNSTSKSTKVTMQPNTALLSMILMFGTFFIGYFLRIFRNGNI